MGQELPDVSLIAALVDSQFQAWLDWYNDADEQDVMPEDMALASQLFDAEEALQVMDPLLIKARSEAFEAAYGACYTALREMVGPGFDGEAIEEYIWQVMLARPEVGR